MRGKEVQRMRTVAKCVQWRREGLGCVRCWGSAGVLSAALSLVIPDDGWRGSALRGAGGLKPATGHQPSRRCQRAATLTGSVQELFTSILCLIYWCCLAACPHAAQLTGEGSSVSDERGEI